MKEFIESRKEENAKANFRWLMKVALGVCCVLQCGTVALATEGTIDVTPPWAKLTIAGAIEKDGTYYVDSTEVDVEIYAHDDTCADTEIEYYISTTPIDTSKPLEESLWQPYTPGLRQHYTLASLTDTNLLYAAFRDAVGNTSLIYEGTDVEYTVHYDGNGGEGSILDGTGYHGMAYVVTNQVPKRDGFYFVGWSTSPTATTASYEQGDIIPAVAFQGTDKVINLYAIWSENKVNLPLLADKVKIGDYVDYPIYYENVEGSGTLSTITGWRVISKDVDLDGNPSPGTVNLVSGGCPLTYYHVGNAADSVLALTTNFLTTEFDDSVTKQKFVKSGFLGYTNLSDVFTNAFTQMEGGVPKVRAMKAEDIFLATGLTEMKARYEMDLPNPKYEMLFQNGEHYWPASAYNASSLWFVNSNGGVFSNASYEYGVRPVVSLKSNVKAVGRRSSGSWQIVTGD